MSDDNDGIINTEYKPGRSKRGPTSVKCQDRYQRVRPRVRKRAHSNVGYECTERDARGGKSRAEKSREEEEREKKNRVPAVVHRVALRRNEAEPYTCTS